MLRIVCIVALSIGLMASTPPARSVDAASAWVVPAPRLNKTAYFSNLVDGASIETPFLLKFGLTGIGIAPGRCRSTTSKSTSARARWKPC